MITFKFNTIWDRNEFIQRVDSMFSSPIIRISMDIIKSIVYSYDGTIISSGPINEFNSYILRRAQWSFYTKEDGIDGSYLVNIPTDTYTDSALSFPTRYDKISTALTIANDSIYGCLSKCISNMFHQPYNIEKVIFNDPATIVFWEDGTKTVVKCGSKDTFDKEKGLAMAYVKKMFGNKGNYFEMFKTGCNED